jgi:hypothetical protein
MYETRNETNPSSGHLCREADPNDLTFPLLKRSRIRVADAMPAFYVSQDHSVHIV